MSKPGYKFLATVKVSSDTVHILILLLEMYYIWNYWNEVNRFKIAILCYSFGPYVSMNKLLISFWHSLIRIKLVCNLQVDFIIPVSVNVQSAKNMQPKPGIIQFKLAFVTYLRHVIILSDHRIYVHISKSVIYRGTYWLN